jgi:hypothetical protein
VKPAIRDDSNSGPFTPNTSIGTGKEKKRKKVLGV